MGSGSLARWSIPRRGWINGNKRKAYGARRRGGLSCVRRLASCVLRLSDDGRNHGVVGVQHVAAWEGGECGKVCVPVVGHHRQERGGLPTQSHGHGLGG